MKVKLDENITYLAVDLLTAGGHDAHTVQMEGLAGCPDAVVWSACLTEKRVLITFDVGDALAGQLAILTKTRVRLRRSEPN